ncbi:MAG: GTPase HflX [Clostridiales bacterium]|nr:GTPase HflX [Clostridiales bacterium]
MAELYENKTEAERAVLAAVDTGEYDCDLSVAELNELALTAGADVVGILTQRRDRPNAGTYFGTGRLEELREFCQNEQADVIIVDNELSPVQQRNIEDATGVRVIDRTTLILDIFAQRANSNEGKLQVELAQLKYSLPRLSGRGKSMSRLGGGIGTRGPGETKLETDKRHIRRRIHFLEQELEELEKRRNLLRRRRLKDGVETVVIVGYTNSGKSTLMNVLTNAGVLAEDKLFATLDPTSRALQLPDGRKIMLIDTVGFIRRLPHHLVEAFKSTLEEAAGANVIVNLCDASDPDCSEHIQVTKQLLSDLGCDGTPVVEVFNKCDLLPHSENVIRMPGSVCISALTGEGLGEFLTAVSKALPPTRAGAKLIIPYTDAKTASLFRKDAKIEKEEYREKGVYLELTAEIALLEKYKNYIV